MNLSSFWFDFLMSSPVRNRELNSSNGDKTSTPSTHQCPEDGNFNGKNQYFDDDLLSPNAPLEDSRQDSKPPCSFIAMISQAVLSKTNRKIVLKDIYQYIMNTFTFYNNKKKAWRNSVRHNLSINECFIKTGRSGNGKGNFWSIHPAYIDNFIKGDYRLRHVRRRTKHKMVSVTTRYKSGYIPMTHLPTGFHQCLSNGAEMQNFHQYQHQESSFGLEMNFSTTGEPSSSNQLYMPSSDIEIITKPFENEQTFCQIHPPFERYDKSTFGVFPHCCQYEQEIRYH
ncbi:unnamed protein product [Mytilus coruscus]|uniref:Fork-head domain-containing protein n=1 Tax=Mytilus coruscus TaxID=42192 RepID=A0A6J8EFA6_MYTCO|nr:unnamed protein product [Mytilus coruscus]